MLRADTIHPPLQNHDIVIAASISDLTCMLLSVPSVSSDAEKRERLDWRHRHQIINGIARGLQYLHEDSQLKVVHRDLNPSNILLDANMDPKISGFGLARIVGRDQTQAVVSQGVVGT